MQTNQFFVRYIQFSNGLFQYTRFKFYRRSKYRTYRTIFMGVPFILAHTGRIVFLYRRYSAVTMAGVPFLDYAATIFMDWWWRTRSNFYRRHIVEVKGQIFYETQIWRSQSNFHCNYLSTIKKSVRLHWAKREDNTGVTVDYPTKPARSFRDITLIYFPLRRTKARFLHRSHGESNHGLSLSITPPLRKASPTLKNVEI